MQIQQSKEQVLSKIIQSRYNKDEQLLYLQQIIREDWNWADVVLERDWSMIKYLNLNNCGITDDTISLLINLNWPHLTYLTLIRNNLTSKGIQLLLNCNLKNLIRLDLNNNQIGNHGAKFLAKMDLPNLRAIEIQHCHIGSQGFKHLSKTRWPKMKYFSLGFQYSLENQNEIKLDSCEMIGQYFFLKLEYLTVHLTEPICMITCVFAQKSNTQICISRVRVREQDLHIHIERLIWGKEKQGK